MLLRRLGHMQLHYCPINGEWTKHREYEITLYLTVPSFVVIWIIVTAEEFEWQKVLLCCFPSRGKGLPLYYFINIYELQILTAQVKMIYWSTSIAGFSQPVCIELHQDAINGTIGESVLLPVSYRLQIPFHNPLPFSWNFINIPHILVTCTLTNCSLNTKGIPTSCSGKYFVHPTYQSRVTVFLENASLLLQSLQLNDSGVYSVIFMGGKQSRNITLTVSVPRLDNRSPGNKKVNYNIHNLVKDGSLTGDTYVQ